MPIVHYYGRQTNFIGKTLFEILSNLRNFGQNRMLIKQEELLKYPGEKCYYIVKKVEPIMDLKLEEGVIYADHIIKGAKVPGLVRVDEQSWHTDWQLVPKDKEVDHRVPDDKLLEHGHPNTVQILPRWMEVPPVMDLFLRRHLKNRTNVQLSPLKLDNPIKIRMGYSDKNQLITEVCYKIAEENEESELRINQPLKTLIKEKFKH